MAEKPTVELTQQDLRLMKAADRITVLSKDNDILKHAIEQNPSAKFHKTPSIATSPFNGSPDVTAFVKSIDPSNAAGTIKFALQLVDQLKGQGGPFQLIENMLGGGLEGLIQNFTQMLQQGMSAEAEKIEQKILEATQKRNKNKKPVPIPTINPKDLISQADMNGQNADTESS